MLVASSSVIKSLLLPRSPVVHVDPSRRLLQQAPGEKDEIIFPFPQLNTGRKQGCRV